MGTRRVLSKNPFTRAEQRLFAAIERGEDPEKAARTRMNRCQKPAKLLGLYYACRDYGLKEVAREVRAKCIEMELTPA